MAYLIDLHDINNLRLHLIGTMLLHKLIQLLLPPPSDDNRHSILDESLGKGFANARCGTND